MLDCKIIVSKIVNGEDKILPWKDQGTQLRFEDNEIGHTTQTQHSMHSLE